MKYRRQEGAAVDMLDLTDMIATSCYIVLPVSLLPTLFGRDAFCGAGAVEGDGEASRDVVSEFACPEL
jgi:hypothetical protein